MQAAAFATSDGSVTRAATSSRAVWAGRILCALPLMFLMVDAIMKVLTMPVAVEASKELGFTETAVFAVGVIEAICLVLYLVPRTAILGAVLWTGYFGGAIATHVIAGNPLFTHTLSPVYVASLLWIGLWLRDGRLRRIAFTAFAGKAS
jgi:hypothetical protein